MTIWRYGDNINTDMLFPGKYTYTCATEEEILPHLLEDLDPTFAKNVQPVDFVFAGRNFGCGSSREQPVIGLKAVGVTAVVAKSFARIFYRSGLNQGLLLIESPEAVEVCNEHSAVHLNVETGRLTIDGQTFTFPPLPPEILAIRKAGGLLPYVREKLKSGSTS